jgi:hypothetical protein
LFGHPGQDVIRQAVAALRIAQHFAAEFQENPAVFGFFHGEKSFRSG